jgi:type IV fimbrial biogenesis protein FimT
MNIPISSFTRTASSFSHIQGSHVARGFTLIELMIVLAVASVLLGTAIPTMTSMTKSVQLSSASNQLLAGLLLARSEAIKRNGRGVICKSADGATCSASGDWEQGWLVFHDADNDGSRDAGEAIVQQVQHLAGDLRVKGNLSVGRYISYGADGGTRFASGGFQAGTITVCLRSANAGEARQIIVSSSGRPRVQKTRVDDCT